LVEPIDLDDVLMGFAGRLLAERQELAQQLDHARESLEAREAEKQKLTLAFAELQAQLLLAEDRLHAESVSRTAQRPFAPLQRPAPLRLDSNTSALPDGGPASVSAAAARDWDNPDASSAMAERGRAMAMSAQLHPAGNFPSSFAPSSAGSRVDDLVALAELEAEVEVLVGNAHRAEIKSVPQNGPNRSSAHSRGGLNTSGQALPLGGLDPLPYSTTPWENSFSDPHNMLRFDPQSEPRHAISSDGAPAMISTHTPLKPPRTPASKNASFPRAALGSNHAASAGGSATASSALTPRARVSPDHANQAARHQTISDPAGRFENALNERKLAEEQQSYVAQSEIKGFSLSRQAADRAPDPVGWPRDR